MPYIPHSQTDIQEMLTTIGVKSLDDLFQSIPSALRLKKPLRLPPPMSELEISRHIKQLANQNISNMPSFLGAGCYHHFIPAIVNHLAGRSEFYTSYTPYQAEASQGILQAFFEYQTMICELTGMEVANASVYDGATGLAEAVLMALSITGKKKVLLTKTIHPEYRQVVQTYLKDLDATITEIDYKNGRTDLATLYSLLAMASDTACVAVQNPNFFGQIEDMTEISQKVHQAGALLIAVVNPISLGLLLPPGEYQADIVVGEGQPLGNEMSFGGPHLGIFATRKEYVRKMPGRLVGQTVDTRGQPGYVLTLSTREQHIRREKATSNICSNEALCALKAAIYLATLGKNGIRKVAELCLQKAHYLSQKITRIKVPRKRGQAAPSARYKLLFDGPFFNEFVIQCPRPPELINKRLLKNGIIGGLALGRFYPELKNAMLFSVTEMNTREEMDKLIDLLR